VLGRYPAYIRLAESIPSRYFNVPMRAYQRMLPTERWAANVRFLDRAITRGDEVWLATNAGDAGASTFAQEVRYLMDHGYVLADDGWRLLPPGW